VVLDHWAVHWWQALGTGVPVVIAAPVVPSLVRYLDQVLGQVTGDPAFLVMADDLATMVRRLEDVLHAGERPERSRVPCWECGTRLVKVWASKAKDDHWLCPRCGELYNAGRYERAKHDHLASAGANRYVSVSDATVAIGRPAQTVRSWLRRGLVGTGTDPRTGRLTVWWPDVRNLHLSTATRQRQRPGA
jgi:ribosomal protein L37AE/L43A